MKFDKLKEFFGPHLEHVTFTGGTAVFLLCKSRNSDFIRRTNDIDALVKFTYPRKKALEEFISQLPGATVPEQNDCSHAKYIRIGNYHIDLLREKLTLLPHETVEVEEHEITITAPADLAGTKLARFTHAHSFSDKELRTHDILDLAVLNEIAHKDPEKHQAFLEKASLVFITRLTAYRMSYEEAISELDRTQGRLKELRAMMPTDDKESPLFYLDERSFDNIITAFSKFTKQVVRELKSEPEKYSEIVDIINCPILPQYSKPSELAKHLIANDFFATEEEAQDYSKRSFQSPQIKSHANSIVGFS